MARAPFRLFTPEGPGPWPGVVMYPDAGGVRYTFDQMAAKLAGFGYADVLPDVYYRNGDWTPFDMATVFGDEGERRRLFTMIGSITGDKMAEDAGAFFDYLAARPRWPASGSACAAIAWAGGPRWWWPAAFPTASPRPRPSTAEAW